MKKTTLLLLPILFCALISFAQTTTSTIVLNKGQKFSLNSVTTGTTSMEMMGQNMETSTESTGTGTFEVKDVNPSSYKLTTRINKMKIKSKAMGQEMNFDSDKNEDMNGEMGQAVKDQLLPKDEEISYSGKSLDKPTSAAGNDDMKKVMESLSGAGNNGAAGNFILIPAGKKSGDSWMDSTSTNGVKVSNAYTLKQLSGNEAVVLVNTVSNINRAVQAQGQDINIAMDLKASTTNIVDVTTGLIKEKKTVAEGKGNISAAGQEMPMTSKITTVTTIKSM